MENKALIIDIQNTRAENFQNKDKNYYLDSVLANNTPTHIALTLYQRDQWADLEGKIGEVASREGSGLLLEGTLHVCTQRNHKIRDPHHEGICTSFFQESESYQQQLEKLLEGKELLKKIFDIDPIGYVPPQHLWNKDTRRAVEDSGMKYLITNAIFSEMYPYQEGNVIIVPSGSAKHGRTNNPVIHFYYDRILGAEKMLEEIEPNISPLSEIPVLEKTIYHRLNSTYLWTVKQTRDGKRLIKWLSDEDTRLAPDANTLRESRMLDYQRHRKEVLGR